MISPDTLRDLRAIIAKMRKDVRPYGISNERLQSYADSLEAVLAREESPTSPAPTPSAGDAAAMRKALEFAEDELWALGAFDSSKRVAAALSEPARNCDVGTAEEQQERFREFCRRHEAAGECGIGSTQAKCPCWRGPKNPDCALVWAQMLYEAEGGAE